MKNPKGAPFSIDIVCGLVKEGSNAILKVRVHHHTATIGNERSPRSRYKASIQSPHQSSFVIQKHQEHKGSTPHLLVHTGRIGLNDRLGRFEWKGQGPCQRSTDTTLEEVSIQ